jgi:hypothetical protein
MERPSRSAERRKVHDPALLEFLVDPRAQARDEIASFVARLHEPDNVHDAEARCDYIAEAPAIPSS